MAETSTLRRHPGVRSLRAEPTGWVTPEGTHAYVFGQDDPGWAGRFGPGEYIQILQTGLVNSATFIRCSARLRGPSTAPPNGWRWEAYGAHAGIDSWAFELIPGLTRDLSDLVVPTQGLGAAISLQYGLRVVGPGGAEPVELEIPAFYLDAIILEEIDGLIVANRSPEPDAVGIPRDEVIQFDLMDSSGDPDPTVTQVYIEGVLAYDGTAGGAQPGYTVAITTPDNGVRRFRITLPYLMDSLRVMDVRVVSANVAATHSLDASWSFTVEDLSAPHVSSAVSVDHMTVRVTFDEPVEDVEAGDFDFVRLEAPSVEVAAVSVSAITDSVYDITLDVPITRGALYRVIVSDVADMFGNAIAAPYDRAEFRGYECPSPSARRAELWRWIPQINRERDETRDLYRFVSVLQEVFDLLICDVDRWTEILDVDLAAERYLDQMLIGLGNPFSFDLTIDDKRRLILILVEIYRLKGTAIGVINVIRFFVGVEVTIDAYNSTTGAWILGESELDIDTILGPGTLRERFSFDVISPVELTEAQRIRIRMLVEYMKPGHTHFVNLIEPTIPEVIDHLELGISELGEEEWMLH